MKLTPQQAKEAARRRKEYQHSLAIEGITFSPEELEVLETLNHERMGYEEGVQFVIDWCRRRGLIPCSVENPKAAE